MHKNLYIIHVKGNVMKHASESYGANIIFYNWANGPRERAKSPGLNGQPCLVDFAMGKGNNQILPVKIIADGSA